jgi:hypothetical protein
MVLVMTYSTIQASHPFPSGIRIFERLFRDPPEWYIEHNQNKIVDDNNLIGTIEQNGAKIEA